MILPRRKLSATVPAMAMGDIAFLLLIFFVILARIRDDSHIQWKPADGSELVKPETMRVSVAIDKEGVTYLNGRVLSETADSAAIRDMLTRALYNENGAPGERGLLGDAPPGKRTVLLKIHRDTPYRDCEPVIEAVSVAGGELHHVMEEKK